MKGFIRVIPAITGAVLAGVIIRELGIFVNHRIDIAFITVSHFAEAFIFVSILQIRQGWLTGIIFELILNAAIIVILLAIGYPVYHSWKASFLHIFTSLFVVELMLSLAAGALGGYAGSSLQSNRECKSPDETTLEVM